MPTLQLYRWHIRDDRGRMIATRFRMSEFDAKKLDQQAKPMLWSLEVREVPDDWRAMSTSSFQRVPTQEG